MKSLISISEMAKLHGLTRQTLIYYDEIDLFKPARVDEKGYRYYSNYQIPYLREICFLKFLGVSLKEIVTHFHGRCPKKEMALLEKRKKDVLREIARLSKIREAINQRISIYEEVTDADTMQMQEPFIRPIVVRQAIFKEYIQPINKENLHLTLMSLWREIFKKEMAPSGGFGSIIKMASILSGEPLKGAGSCVFLSPWSTEHANTVGIPSSHYVCMYKYGMPYDMTHVKKLMDWMAENGYGLAGDIVDVCLLDTTFYKTPQSVDFCMLQAPVNL
ncbi:MerR family transcriptional regulator [Acetonema longum]|uniref:MerR family transcriptional regulator n=1 Tax=Acetonema longum DSM 6540 TaxID=1009370 RepID=F7NM82_9FIRM|nr:MerR family transcriptional regulator [Acetonema longum]EGO62820.1 MerR family transcriptional regulator [Acetonema longum DSM 6540]